MLRIIFSGPKKTAKGPAIFIDRDGVINHRRAGDYVLDWSQFVFMPGIQAALKQLASLQLPMILISNQAAIGKGLLDPAGLQKITAQLREVLLADGTDLVAAYFCPHRPDENCACRKPKPALLLSAADDFNIDMARSIFIGDSDSDVLAARSAGCQPILFGAGLQACSGSPDWAKDVPTARSSDEMFDVALKSLRTQNSAASGDHIARQSKTVSK